MNVTELLHHKLETMGPNATAREIAARMDKYNIGAIPIVEGNTVLGIVTDRDLAVKVLGKMNSPEKVQAKDFMTKDVQTVLDNQDVEHCAQVMEQRHIRRCLVLDHRSKKPIGIVSLRDLAMNMGSKDLAGDMLLSFERSQTGASGPRMQ